MDDNEYDDEYDDDEYDDNEYDDDEYGYRDATYWFPPSKPIAVDGGIKTRKKQGAIGESWWSKRFIEVLESISNDNRLSRGRSYARKGQVVSIDVQPGIVHAVVQGSRKRPYRVTICVDALSSDDWTTVQTVFASKAMYFAKLLTGEMPRNIEQAFAECSLSLFPRSAEDIDTSCSCPDIANPCKHIAAALYLLAESFDDDPFRIFLWRGRGKTELLSCLQANKPSDACEELMKATDSSSSGEAHKINIDDVIWSQLQVEGKPIQESVDEFWNCGESISDARISVTASPYADVLLRQLAPLPNVIHLEKVAVDEVLNELIPIYHACATEAERLANQGASPPLQ